MTTHLLPPPAVTAVIEQQQLLYIFIPTFIVWLIHRPMITKIDLIKYIIFTCTAFTISFFTVQQNSWWWWWSSMQQQNQSEQQQMIFSLDSSNNNETTEQDKLFLVTATVAEAIKYSLISIFTISITCLFTRWHFPITFITTPNPIVTRVFKYFLSLVLFIFVLFVVLLSSNQPMWFALVAAVVIATLWLIGGLYFIKRYMAVISSTLLATLFAIVSTTTSYNYAATLHWFFISLALVLSCNTLDYLDAILNTFPHLINIDKLDQEKYQSPYNLFYWKAIYQLLHLLLFLDNNHHFSNLNTAPIKDLETALRILGPSRSWKAMAAFFPVNLRQDLCLLYAFFRTADDLVDDVDVEQGEKNLEIIRMFLQDIFFCSSSSSSSSFNNGNTTTTAAGSSEEEEEDKTLPSHINWDQYNALLPYNQDVLAIFRNLARISHYLCPRAMFELTNAWQHDLQGKPCKTAQDLLDYAAQISGTFGQLCTCVIMYKTGHCSSDGGSRNWSRRSSFFASIITTTEEEDAMLSRARSTGQCLQLINIARDIITDSFVGRCYVPLEFMSCPSIYFKLTKTPFQIPEHVLKSYSLHILDLADQISSRAQEEIEALPREVQPCVQAAFQIYMAIGTTLRQCPGFPTRAKVPKWKQKWIAFCCIYLGNVLNRKRKDGNMMMEEEEKEEEKEEEEEEEEE